MTVAEMNRPVTNNIIRLIEDKGLKNKAVAERAGFSQQNFSEILNGKRIIKICDVNMLANALGVTPGELFQTEEE